jgi:superfamily II DNA helicase RecQ
VKDIIPTQMYWRNSEDIIPSAGLIIVTPEQVDHRIEKEFNNSYVIVDEIHLWAHWGDSFRPVMWEAYFSLCEISSLVIHLTATVNEELHYWIKHSQCQFDEISVFDYGNNQMKYSPHKIIFYPDSFCLGAKETIRRKLKTRSHGVKLVFCAYRQEVSEWGAWCKENGIAALTCVGGGARKFQEDLLNSDQSLQVIISTTVLSHGVNLPEITGVYFTYKVEDQDFWLQMVTRGGRRGQAYEVLTMDKDFIKASRRITGFFAMLREEFFNKLVSFFNSEGPWNLKASSPPKSLTKSAI